MLQLLMESQINHLHKIVSPQRFDRFDLPIFVQLYIQKRRDAFLKQKVLEAKRLMGTTDDRVNVRKIGQSSYVLEHEYADSRCNTRNNRISKTKHANLPQVELKVRKVLSY